VTPTPVGFYIAAAVAAAIALWTLVAAVVHVVRRWRRIKSFDFVFAVLFSGGLVVLALWLMRMGQGASG
jgi:hypothetical protein